MRPSRPVVHKIGVGLLLFFDSICTLAVSFNVCMDVVGTTTPNLRLIIAPLAVSIITTYLCASIAQMFLCNLFYIL